jgi:hypothetical protein
MQGKLLRQVLDKMMTSGHAQNARVQVLLPDGKYYDITSLQLLVLDACLKVPKLYEGSCIRELVANGLKLEPRTQGWINSEEFFQCLALNACRFVITCHVSWYMLQACCLALDACCLMLES